ncbi:DUF1566 domain-containing protein [Desulfobacterales bacterium HSG16]|nr:DUF1566 domain-containing protein [Desulfobacterales bacterium HSG16]
MTTAQINKQSETHLRTLSLSHVKPPSPSRPAAWLRGIGALGYCVPLFLIQDLGTLLTMPRQRLRISRPDHLPDDIDTSAYSVFLDRMAGYALLCQISAWNISDSVAGVIIAKLLNDVKFPGLYAIPGGNNGADFARRLGVKMDRADPAGIWRETLPEDRPVLSELLPEEAMTDIAKNLRNLDEDELRFLHRYGPRFAGAPDPEDMLDLFSLLNLPPSVRLAMSQVMSLLPRISQTTRAGGTQTYAMGGYEGLTRKGSLDSIIPTELACPDDILFHRLLNNEALYYGREGERERQKALAYIVTQSGMEMLGDFNVMAQALTLALAQAMQSRGYEVLQSFAGNLLTPPAGMNKPKDVHRILYYQDKGWSLPEKILNNVSELLRSWKEEYRSVQVFWVVNEFWDADDWDLHQKLYRNLKKQAGQQIWFIQCGYGRSKLNGTPPVAARQFHRYHIVHTESMWKDRKPPRVDFTVARKRAAAIEKKKADPLLRSEFLTVSDDDAAEVFGLKLIRKTENWTQLKPVEHMKNDFEDRGDIIFDRETGLTWQKSDSGNEMTYEEAEAYVSQLNHDHFEGCNDWHLPTVDELVSLIEPEQNSAGLYIDPIFDCSEGWYWNWTSDKRVGGGAWYVGFNLGNVGWHYLKHH